MKENSSKASCKGMGLGSFLTILFIILKLCHVIDWAWVWVLAPAWISAGLVVLILVFCLLMGIIAAMID